MASTAPSKWMSQRNLYLTSAESREIVDVYQSKARAQMSKLYVERMIRWAAARSVLDPGLLLFLLPVRS